MALRFAIFVWLLGGSLLASPARADGLADIRRRGELAWCGDQEGGGPYVFPRDDDPSRVTGFEVDLAAHLAGYLKVVPRFVQGPWDKLGGLVDTKKCDVILNGYELTPERAEAFEATIPYYVYGLQLLVRKGGPLEGWDDLGRRDRPRAKIGVLTGSAAETRMKEFCGTPERCEVISYDGSTDALREVETGKLDATLQDTPIARFYAPRFPALVPVGEPVGKGYYVAFVRKGARELRDALSEALILLSRNGTLAATYRSYGIWDDAQRELEGIVDHGRFYGFDKAVRADVSKPELPDSETVHLAARKRGFEVVRAYGGVLLESAALTLMLAFGSFPLAMALGLLVAVLRLYGPSWLRAPLAGYVEFLRGTPLMLQLYFLFFVLPEVGVTLPAFWTGILGLAINYSAYESEIYRAGLQAIPHGQLEAALSLGMSHAQAVRRILVPQAVRLVIPPVVNDFIALFKDTSVVSVVTLVELTKRFSVLSLSTQATLELMGMTAVLYLLMSYPMSLLSRRLEERLGVAT
ncbi:MAG: ABC transporter permease subunit [Deltaproteobacteria bacterium]|nr:ABC transporter permease subunit [Deltaproteobacteria bacterium]